ncbi:MAG: hypothetical protein ACSLE1_18165 [Sphingobium sp.]
MIGAFKRRTPYQGNGDGLRYDSCDEIGVGGSQRKQVCFFFNAQRHQLLHGIGTAVELGRLSGFDVHVISPAAGHVEYAREVVEKLGGAPITFVHVRSPILEASMVRFGRTIPPKLLSLAVLAKWLNHFDAICHPGAHLNPPQEAGDAPTALHSSRSRCR